MQTIRGAGLFRKHACEVVLSDSTFLTTLLPPEACNGGLNKAVLVPLRMVGNKKSPWRDADPLAAGFPHSCGLASHRVSRSTRPTVVNLVIRPWRLQ